jgi:uncharacterized protein (UPF0332 family)
MREQQLALIQKAQESLRASQVLQAEALYNFAASRAYYTIEKRTRGDYETDVPVSNDESLEIIERSQIFIEAAQKWMKDNETNDLDD